MFHEKTWSFRIRVILLFLVCTIISFAVRTCSYNREAATLAVAIVLLLHKDEAVEKGDFVIPKNEVLYWIKNLNMPFDPKQTPFWMH